MDLPSRYPGFFNQRFPVRTCSSCEWTYWSWELESCPKCQFAHYGAPFCYSTFSWIWEWISNSAYNKRNREGDEDMELKEASRRIRWIAWLWPTKEIILGGPDQADTCIKWSMKQTYKEIFGKVYLIKRTFMPPPPPEHPNCRCIVKPIDVEE